MERIYIDELLENYKLWYPLFYEKTVDYQFVSYNTLIAVLNDGSKIEYCSLDNSMRDVTRLYEPSANILDDEDTWRTEFGKSLKRAINAAGISQDALADRLGVSRQMVSRYVNGHTTPSGYIMARMSKILRCNVRALLTFDCFDDNQEY